MPYPDKVLTGDEEVVAALHPHASAVFWPVVRLLAVVGGASFGMALVPGGPDQGVLRLVVLGVAVLLVLLGVVGPVLRWRTTHYVLTTSRVLHRTGLLARSGRDLALSRITDVSFDQTLWERVIRSGTLRIASAGEMALVLRRVPRAERVQALLHHLVEEEAGRRTSDGAVHVGEAPWFPVDDDRWSPVDDDGWLPVDDDGRWGTAPTWTASLRTGPVG